MRAIEISPPGGMENLRLIDKPAPPPPGAGEVLLQLKASSLNARDVGMANRPTDTPVIPFSDGCAVVEAVGPGVNLVKAGDRVSTLFYPNWLDGQLTAEKRAGPLGGSVGAAVEQLILPQTAVAKVPDHLSDHQVATLACAAVTAWHALVVAASAQAGQTVVLQGTGGVSIFALQFAKALGCRTIITSSSAAKLDRAKALGATHCINYLETPEWSKEVRRLTEGRGSDVVIEVGGAGTLQESLRATAIGGAIAIVGVLTGAQEALPIPTVMGNVIKLQGVTVGSREMFADMCRTIEEHRIEPVVDSVFALTDFADAFAAMKSGDRFGKIVVDYRR